MKSHIWELSLTIRLLFPCMKDMAEATKKMHTELLLLDERSVCMQKRKLEDLNLLDDFLFNKIVSHAEYGEQFSRELLRIVLGKTVGRLKVIPQKVYYGSDSGLHGARLDVYLEDEDAATIYDVEPEQITNKKKMVNIPKRVRFYHSKIDATSLNSGADYQQLKNVIVIMIMSEDPFGYNHMVYTIENSCKELPDMPYDDGAKTLFLYTRGTEGNPTEELRSFLCYMEQSNEENAKSDWLKEVHQMVRGVKRNEEVSLEYMKIFEREQMVREEGRSEKLRELIIQKLQRGDSNERIADDLMEDIELVIEVAKEEETR